MSARATPEQLAEFDRDGFLVVRGFFDACECAELRHHEHPRGEDEVVRGKPPAVVPREVRPKMVGRLHAAVGEDAPGVRPERGNRLGEVWHGVLPLDEAAKRDKAVEEFNDGSLRVLLVAATGQLGLNLQSAAKVAHLDLPAGGPAMRRGRHK